MTFAVREKGQTMTYEQLKAVAKEHGYNLTPIKPYVKFLPCTCGSNHRETWLKWNGEEEIITYMCKRCGKKASGIGYADAKRNWNNMIRSETDE